MVRVSVAIRICALLALRPGHAASATPNDGASSKNCGQPLAIFSPSQGTPERLISLAGDTASFAKAEAELFRFANDQTSAVSAHEATSLLSGVVKQMSLPVCNLQEGCRQRANLIAASLAEKNLRVGRIRLFGDKTVSVKVKSRFNNLTSGWGQHVVPYLKIKNSSEVLVLDTAVSDEGLPFSKWLNEIKQASGPTELRIEVTPATEGREPFKRSPEDLEWDLKQLKRLAPYHNWGVFY